NLELRPNERHPANPGTPQPSSFRLEVGRVDLQGRVLPAAGTTTAVPLEGPPTFETGAFVELPRMRVGRNAEWMVDEIGRTPRTWRVSGSDYVNNTSCL